jgi:hypothetical protein
MSAPTAAALPGRVAHGAAMMSHPQEQFRAALAGQLLAGETI